MIKASICLSDIPKERIVTAKNGKKYLNFDVSPYKNGKDKYDNTHTLYLYDKDTKEKIYIGNGKEWDFDNANHNPEPASTGVNGYCQSVDDDLPF